MSTHAANNANTISSTALASTFGASASSSVTSENKYHDEDKFQYDLQRYYKPKRLDVNFSTIKSYHSWFQHIVRVLVDGCSIFHCKIEIPKK